MSLASDDELTSHGEMVFDEEFLDDSAPTRVSIDPRRELMNMLGREQRPEQVRVGEYWSASTASNACIAAAHSG